MKDCIFCKIINGSEKSLKVFENKHTIAFAPNPNTIISKRHLIIAPKKHYENIYDIPENELFNIVKTTKFISQKLKSRFNADGVNILHASGEVAQQSVFHFHLHLVPRYFDDNVDVWPDTGYREDNFPNISLEM
ncbi:MAG: HIT domain-containing protein [Promethearchaeota archaeon]|nr:MAG: HIT domain-containing protein [Candidatus Lokiarchaeota archaeon]